MLKSRPAARMAIGAGLGTVVGAAHLADEGQQVDTMRNLKKPVRMSSNITPTYLAESSVHGVGQFAGGGLAAYLAHRATRKKEQQMSSRIIPVQFAEALTGRLASDRYRKKIHDEDLDRRDANILRTTAAGAALGGMLRGKKGALIGAAVGAPLVPLIRAKTESGKDMYGDRSRQGKQAEGAPWKLATAGALGLAGKVGYDKLEAAKIAMSKWGRRAKVGALAAGGLYVGSKLFSSKTSLIQFKRAEENPEYEAYQRGVEVQKADDRDWRKAKTQIGKVNQGIGRGHRLLKDVVQAAKGQKNLDSRGRERKREWDKPWVKAAVMGGIGTLTAATFHKVMRGTGPGTGFQRMKKLYSEGKVGDAIGTKLPILKPFIEAKRKFRSQAADEAAGATHGVFDKAADWVEGNSAPIPQSTKDLVGEARRRAMKHNSSITGILSGKSRDIMRLPKNEFKSKSRVIALRSREDYEAELEDFANKSGKTLKPYHRRDLLKAHQALDPRAVQRNRSELAFYKKKDFEHTVTIPAIAGGSFIGGGLAAQLYAKRDRAEVPKTSPTPGGGTPRGSASWDYSPTQGRSKIVPFPSGIARKAAKVIRHSAIDANPLIRLNSALDLLLV
jgi:hypothetical protein